MKKPRISVVIPTLNEEFYLPKLLKDLSKQKGEIDHEVIIVDGCSEDKTREVAQAFDKDFSLTVVESSRRNLSFQRNLGVKKAKGDYVILIDADCRLDKDFLQKVQHSIATYRPLVTIPTIVTYLHTHANQTTFQLSNYVIEISQKVGRPVSPGACLIFARSFFSFIGGFEVSTKQDKKILFPEDMELMQKVYRAGVRAYFMRDTLVYFSLRRYKKEGHLKVLTKYFIGIIDSLTKGRLQTPDVPYEMGGQYYGDPEVAPSVDQFEKYKKQLRSLRRQFILLFGD